MVLVLALVFVLWLVVLPMTLLVLNSFRIGPPSFFGGTWTLRNYVAAFNNPFFLGAFFNTALFSVIATAGGLATAVLFAWLIERSDMPFRGAAWVVMLLPIAMPGVIFALTWMLLLMPEVGLVNIAIRWLLVFLVTRWNAGHSTFSRCGASSFSAGCAALAQFS